MTALKKPRQARRGRGENPLPILQKGDAEIMTDKKATMIMQRDFLKASLPLFGAVKEIIKKYDGKMLNCKLAKAMETLKITTQYGEIGVYSGKPSWTSRNSYQIEINGRRLAKPVKHTDDRYTEPVRPVSPTYTMLWAYDADRQGILQGNKKIVAAEWLKMIDASRTELLEHIAKINDDIEHVDEKIKQYEELKRCMKTIKESLDSYTNTVYEYDFK